MNRNDLETDLSLLRECEFIRYTLEKDTLTLMVVADCPEDMMEHDHCHEEEEEEDGCCEGLNGHLFLIHFSQVTSFHCEGQECDNYVLKSGEVTEHHVSLAYDGYNLFEADGHFSFSFDFVGYEVEDGGKIEGCGV